MSLLVKGDYEAKAILDFSSRGKLSKNFIKQSLRKIEITDFQRLDDQVTFIDNYISVGMYEIHLYFSGAPSGEANLLKNCGGFHVAIFEVNHRNNVCQNIKLSTDARFKNQYWISLSNKKQLKINNLVDIILYAKRLNSLKIFL